MPRPDKVYTALPILGVDSSVPAGFLDPRATPDAQNIRILRSEVKKMSGYTTLGSSFGGQIQRIISLEEKGIGYLVGISTTKCQQYAYDTQWVDKTGTALTGNIRHPVSAVVGRLSNENIVIFCNFVDNIRKFVIGSDTADLGGSPPLAKYMLWMEGYLLLAHVKDSGTIYQDKIQWCDTDDPESWTEGVASNAGHKYLGESQRITGMIRLKNLAIATTPTSIWGGYLTGDDRVFQFEPIETKLGYQVGNTLQVTPYGAVLGLSRHGLVEFNGVSAKLVGQGIYDDLKDEIDAEYIDQAFAEIVAEVNEYWLYIPITGQSGNITRRYRYNYTTGQVYKDTVTNITAMGLSPVFEATVIDSVSDTIDDVDTLIDFVGTRRFFPPVILGDSSGQCYKWDWDETDENGSAIDGYWSSKDFYGNPGYYSLWGGLDVECYGTGTLDVYYSTDEGATWTQLTSQAITLTSAVSNYTVYFDVLAEKIRVRFRNSTSNETFTLRGFHLHRPILRESIN